MLYLSMPLLLMLLAIKYADEFQKKNKAIHAPHCNDYRGAVS